MSIDRNTFTNNSAGAEGGALTIGDRNGPSHTNMTVGYNLLKSNSTDATGGGLAIKGPLPNLDVFNNVIERNTARDHGGNLVVSCEGCDNTTNFMNIDNNTVALGSAPEGGGIVVESLTDNNGDGFGDGVALWNDVSYLNLSGDFDVPTGSVPVRAFNSVIGTTGNGAVCDALDSCLLAANPQFISSPTDNFHIPVSSPAVNLGAPTTPPGTGVTTPTKAPADDCSEPPASNDCGTGATPGPRVSLPDAGAYEAQGQNPNLPTRTPPVTRTPTPCGGTCPTPTDTAVPTITINFTQTITQTAAPTITVNFTQTATNTVATSTPTNTKTVTNTPLPTITVNFTETPTSVTLTPTGTPCVPGPNVTCPTPTNGTPVGQVTNTPSPTNTQVGAPTVTNTPTRTLTRTPGGTPCARIC
jgi:hypothetical protein